MIVTLNSGEKFKDKNLYEGTKENNHILTDMVIAYKKSHDEDLMNEIINNSILFISKIAIRRYGSVKHRLFNYDDLIQEGLLGLMRAIDKFDPRKDIEFLSYAGWWIDNFIQRFVCANTFDVTMSIPHAREVRHFITLSKIYPEKSREEILSMVYIENGNKAIQKALLEDTGLLLKDPIFLDKQVYSGDDVKNDNNIGESLISSNMDEYNDVINKDTIEHLLSYSSEYEAEFLKKYYGLCGEEELTSEELRKEYNLENINSVHNKKKSYLRKIKVRVKKQKREEEFCLL